MAATSIPATSLFCAPHASSPAATVPSAEPKPRQNCRRESAGVADDLEVTAAPGKNPFRQNPLLSRLRLRQRLLKLPHQFLPLLHLGICRVRAGLRRE